jgi:hypothetical protein
MVGALMLGASEAVAPIALGQAEIGRTVERMVVKLNNSPPVDGNQVDTIPVRPPSSPASTATIVVTASGVQSRTQIRLAHTYADEIMLMLEKTMTKVCEWSESIKAQTTATVERDVGASNQL